MSAVSCHVFFNKSCKALNGRRIPFESPAYSAYWNRASGESLHIPTFSSGAAGPYLPGTAIKGALRTGMVSAHWKSGVLNEVAARIQGDRVPRRLSEAPEEQALGNSLRTLKHGVDQDLSATMNVPPASPWIALRSGTSATPWPCLATSSSDRTPM